MTSTKWLKEIAGITATLGALVLVVLVSIVWGSDKISYLLGYISTVFLFAMAVLLMRSTYRPAYSIYSLFLFCFCFIACVAFSVFQIRKWGSRSNAHGIIILALYDVGVMMVLAWRMGFWTWIIQLRKRH